MEDGSSTLLGLRDVLVDAHRVQGLFDTSPVVTVALHRLLLAILHRNFGPESWEAWRDLWQSGKGRWDAAVLDSYFSIWRDRFCLFDETHPFYQTKGVPFSRTDRNGKDKSCRTGIPKIAQELDMGATLFDHTVEEPPPMVPPAKVAGYLVAIHAFHVGGLVTPEWVGQKKVNPSANAAPLTKGAVALVEGGNLFQTLMLNFHLLNYEDGEPLDGDPSIDAPAWELNSETTVEDRRPNGYLDLLTWQSRRIRLDPADMPDGVRYVVFMKGSQFPRDYTLHGKETMLAFRKNANARAAGDPWLPLTFREERAVWRDSLSLFQTVVEERARPKMLDWLSDLASPDCSVLDRSTTFPLALAGLSTNQAKIMLWRHERLPMPLTYLSNRALVDSLRQALDQAERVGRLFEAGYDERDGKKRPRPMQVLASRILSPGQGRTPDQDDVRRMATGLAPNRVFWTTLEAPFREFLVKLAADHVQGEDGLDLYGGTALPQWASTVRRAAMDAFEEAARGLDQSARTLKAIAEAEGIFHGELHRILAPSAEEEVAHEPAE